MVVFAMSAPSASHQQQRELCERRQGLRQFREPGTSARPPLLWTFPGAGNTWVRLLLDFATGLYTGSVYSDLSLLPVLPGEGACDSRALAVKAHPTNIDFHDFIWTEGITIARAPTLWRQTRLLTAPPLHTGGSVRLNVTRKPEYLKCASLRFDAVVFLVRVPLRGK